MTFIRTGILGGLVLLTIAGCSKSANESQTSVAPLKPDPWVLSCNDPNAEQPALLWNGLLGVRIGRDGAFVGNRFEIDAYESEGEEKIMPLPALHQATWQVNGEILSPKQGKHYLQSLDMRDGLLKTAWQQGGIKVECVTAVDPDRKEVSQQWSFSGLKAPARLAFKPGARVDRFQFDAWQIRKRGPAVNLRSAGFRLEPESSGDARAVLHWRRAGDKTATEPMAPFSRAVSFWGNKDRPDIEIDGPVEDQQAVRSFLFYLRGSIHPKGMMSVSPFGLSDATYNGHVFWDADVWVFPALALIDHERAQAIAKYRLDKFRKNRTGKTELQEGPFPWQSSVSGREVAPGAMHKEIHVNGGVAWMLDNAAALGLVKPQDADRVIRSVGDFYLSRATKRSDGKYELKDVISPDEFHTGDNDLYTNLLAQWTQNRVGRKASYYLPRDHEAFLTYENDPVRSYKQAAAVLGIYPLQMIDDGEARKMMARYANKVTKNGPAMSHSVHALIWARLGEMEKAYDEWKKSWQLYTNHPLMLFSEKPKKKTTYFTTGAAGCLQTVLYGFLGFRIDYEKDKMAVWSTPLKNGKWISIRPRLPAKWRRVKFTNFIVKGRRFNLNIDASGVKVNQGEP